MERTSISDPIRLDRLPQELLCTPGRLGLTFAPGKKGPGLEGAWRRDLRVDLARLRHEYGVKLIVNLLEDHEIGLLGIHDYLDVARELPGLDVRRLPIRDGGVPDDASAVRALVGFILGRLGAGDHVAVHCRGGLGRAGLVSACCLVQAGFEPEEAIRAVRHARKGAIETQAQEAFVRGFAGCGGRGTSA